MVITAVGVIASIAGITYSRFLVPAPCKIGSGLSRPHPFCRLGLARAGSSCPLPLAGTAPRTSSRYPLALIAYPGFPPTSSLASSGRCRLGCIFCPSLPARGGSPLDFSGS